MNGTVERVEVVTDIYGNETTIVVCGGCSDPFPGDERCEHCEIRLCDLCKQVHDCRTND